MFEEIILDGYINCPNHITARGEVVIMSVGAHREDKKDKGGKREGKRRLKTQNQLNQPGNTHRGRSIFQSMPCKVRKRLILADTTEHKNIYKEHLQCY